MKNIIFLIIILFTLITYNFYIFNKETFTNNKNSILFVSGYWNIKNKHSKLDKDNIFYKWFNNTLNVNEDYYIFSNKKNLEIIKNIRENLVKNKTIYKEKNIEDFFTYKLNINNKTNDIHVPSKELGLIWLEKLELLYEASLNTNYEYYAWIDSGLDKLRNRTNKNPIKLINNDKIKLLSKDKFNYCASNTGNNISNNWDVNEHDVAGGYNIIHKSKIKFFRDLFYEYLNKCLENTNNYTCFSDQIILSKIKKVYPQYFNKLCEGYSCFVDNVDNSNNNTISVNIPCIKRDSEKLNNLVKSINIQTKKPDEIVISYSGVTNKEGIDLKNNLQKLTNIDIKVISSLDKKYAGENRNIAAENSKGNILMFFDADDIMKENRIERIMDLFDEYNSYAVLHSFENKDINKKSNFYSNGLKIYDGNFLYNLQKNSITPYLHIENEKTIHHGHISIKKTVFDNIKFRFDEKYRRGQDSKFVRDLIDYYGNNKNTIIFTNEELSYYIPAENQNHNTN